MKRSTPVDASQSALRDSLHHYRDLINAVGCIVWEGSPVTYAFTFVSEAAEKLLGYPTRRWLDEPTFWVDHIHPDDRAWVLDLCVGETKKGCSHEFEYRMIASDGRIVWLKDIVTVIAENGQPVWSQGVMVDITERKELELALQAQNARLQQLDRLKSELIDTASHELRTPLSSILGFAEFLEDELEGPLSEGQMGFVVQIQESARRLQTLVDDLLDFARWESGELQLALQEADLGALIRQVATSLAPQAKAAGLAMALDTGAQAVRLRFDPTRIEQVVLNLLGNAIKFTGQGGRVSVTVTEVDGHARVEVTDSGIGLAPEHHGRVFEKFFQVDTSSTRPYGGAGLGLAVSKALVEAHGGQIGVLSAPGQGATFWFTLPKT